jgi:hypothetical protein
MHDLDWYLHGVVDEGFGYMGDVGSGAVIIDRESAFGRLVWRPSVGR